MQTSFGLFSIGPAQLFEVLQPRIGFQYRSQRDARKRTFRSGLVDPHHSSGRFLSGNADRAQLKGIPLFEGRPRLPAALAH
jgi:hypothetical protein